MVKESTLEFWNKRAKTLEGKTVTEARYLTEEEMSEFGWTGRGRSLVLVLDEREILVSSRDDEANGPGAILGMCADGSMDFPVVRDYH